MSQPATNPTPREHTEAASRALSVLRIVTAAIFITSGTMKLFGYPPPPPGAMPPLVLLSQVGIGGILETFGGLALLLGLFTRPVAFVLAGEMAIAYFQFHFPQSFFPTVNNGTAAVLDCFIFLYLVIAGPGIWSLDAVIARARRSAAR